MRSLSRRTFTRLSAAIAAGVALPSTPSTSSALSDQVQADGLQSEFLLDLTLETQSPHQLGPASSGRLIVPVTGGTFSGPLLKGTVGAPGGDWITERPDGSRMLDVRVLFLTDDNELVYVSWRGIAFTPPGGSLFARIVPMFETGSTKYSWLNEVVAVGVFRPGAGRVAYRVYRVL